MSAPGPHRLSVNLFSAGDGLPPSIFRLLVSLTLEEPRSWPRLATRGASRKNRLREIVEPRHDEMAATEGSQIQRVEPFFETFGVKRLRL